MAPQELEGEVQKGLEGVIIDESEISRVFGEEGKLLLRGYEINDIAENADYPETLYLVWNGELPTEEEYEKFAGDMAERREIPPEVMDSLRNYAEANLHPMDAMMAATVNLSGYDENIDPNAPQTFEDSIDEVREAGKNIAAKLPTITAAYNRLRDGDEPVEPREDMDTGENFLYMLQDEEPPELFSDLMETAFQIHMDHGTNASTFTARVVASTMANPYEATSSAMGALAGPLHGAANQDTLNMLREIDASDKDVGEWIDDTIDEGGVVYGYGHRVYQTKDPRAFILQDYAEDIIDSEYGDDKWYKLAKEVEAHMDAKGLEEKGIAPNVDFFSGTIYQQMDIPTDIYTNLFTVSRVGGWVGHMVEQYSDNRIIRPRAQYTGPVDLEWTPMDER
ncbi:citrate/2-methylcitrate synthase [Halanaeroarchaeum sulfurireducens]|uniref:Citrate synthase n=1 Tax=Halanaeroarchaeum sulfurireducens TaxID=1604004 RepID=A0A0N9MG79_9EURY|nr:citrate/2-methylcitrate synthase [Halanaeroarchaeum sulfurireducens]ALG81146.1 2-methylcitrate synthase/citrate synthase II [Halanaeroarchaeum sulfurireducens]